MREPEGGFLSRAFIGRHDEREHIKTRLLQDGGVLLLFGQPLVGKACLAQQVAEELKSEQENTPLSVYTVDCKDALDWPGIMRAICRAFSLEEAAANENLLVGTMLHRLQECGGGGKILLLLLRVHGLNPSGTDIHSMTRCLQSLATANVMAIVTSRRQLQLPVQKRVRPLLLNDAIQLLRHHAPDVTADEFQELLQRYCQGLPPLVLQMARLVSGGPMLAYSEAELRQELEADPGLLMQDLGQEAQQLFSALTPEVQGQVTTLANLLDGTFSVEALKAVVGVEGARMKTVLRRLYEEAPILVDNESQRMCIEPLVLHHVRKLGHVSADDQARLRVVTFLGRVLIHAEQNLYVASQDTVYGHLHGDWPQLQHIMRQAIHCTHHTYHAYLQVAFKAEKLLAKCFPHDALLFYRNMAMAAVHFGTARDQAVLQGLIGMAVTQGQGAGWREALQHFHRALPILQQDTCSLHYLRLLCDMGFFYYRLNSLQEADRYLTEAVSISNRVFVEDKRELIFHLLRARNFLAFPSIFRGHLAESKALLLETLDLCEKFAPHHPDKPVLINSLGLVYERSGEDHDKALLCYRQSLVERRRYAAVAPGDLVPTLNNVGMQYSRRGDFDTALAFLEEAAAIRSRENRLHFQTALTQQHMGQVVLQKGDYPRAERHLLEAADIYCRCSPDHDVRGKLALCLAHLYITEPLRDVRQCQQYLQQVWDLSERISKNLSDSGLVVLMSALQHLVQLHAWDKVKAMPLLLQAQQRISMFDGDPSSQLADHLSIISDMITMLQSDFSEDQKETVRSRVMEQCQMCRDLSLNEDTQALWRWVEERGQQLRNALTTLRESSAIKDVLNLSRRYQSLPTSPSPHTLPVLQETRCPGQGQSKLSSSLISKERTSLHHLLSSPQSTAGQGRTEQEQGSINEQLQQVVGRLIEQDLEKGKQYTRGSFSEERDTFLHHSRSPRYEDFTRLGSVPEFRDTILRQTNQNDVTDNANFSQPGYTMPANTATQRSVPVTMATGCHMSDSSQHSSCSFTSSEPPSTSSSDVSSSGHLDSADTACRQQQEAVTLCERIFYPLQETARDQAGPTSNMFGFQETNIDTHGHTPESSHQQQPELGQYRMLTVLQPAETTRMSQPLAETSGLSHLDAETSSRESVTGGAARPPLTLEGVVTCAQQLMAVLPSTNIVTSEQRKVLEKLASLTPPQPVPSLSQGAQLDNDTFHNWISLGDQAAKLVVHSQPSQSQQATQEPDQLQGMIHSLHHFPSQPSQPSQQVRPVPQDHSHHQSESFHDLHQTQTATQSSVETQPAASALTTMVTQDQFQAYTKLSLDSQQFDAAQRQFPPEPNTGELEEGFPAHARNVQSEKTDDSSFSPQKVVRTLHPTEQQRNVITEVPTYVCQATPSDKSTAVTHTVAFPEVGRQTSRFESSSSGIGSATGVLSASTDRRQVTSGINSRVPQPPAPHSGMSVSHFTASHSGMSVPHFTASHSAMSVPHFTASHSGASVHQFIAPHSSANVYQTAPPTSSAGVHTTAVHGRGGVREPTESDDSTEVPTVSPTSDPWPQAAVHQPACREATENDERLDNPHHVCNSVDCCCSLKPLS